jgi:1-aminocyclopropane-1-carboxylate deaminase
MELERGFQPSVLTPLVHPLFTQKKIECWLKRDDLIHPIISGNKWRKLKYILNDILSQSYHTVISMGGAYSNHLHALAFVGKKLNLKTKGFIRGERPDSLNPTLKDIIDWGMELTFVSRSEYRQLRELKQCDALPNLQHGEYWLPEGGSTAFALQGVGELFSEMTMDFDCLCVPCGTGTTLAGLAAYTSPSVHIMGFSALKGADFLVDDVNLLLSNRGVNYSSWSIQLDYHFGGFAKMSNELLLFMQDFKKQQHIELDPVYTGKMLFGLFDLIRQDYFKQGQRIVAIHTGGLQGNRQTW